MNFQHVLRDGFAFFQLLFNSLADVEQFISHWRSIEKEEQVNFECLTRQLEIGNYPVDRAVTYRLIATPAFPFSCNLRSSVCSSGFLAADQEENS